ncbi:hypothetical protein Hanom_Chr02g00162801 [Helianthus anomalus]
MIVLLNLKRHSLVVGATVAIFIRFVYVDCGLMVLLNLKRHSLGVGDCDY